MSRVMMKSNKNPENNSNMNDYIENILAENLTLKRKLDSKSQALLILSKDLNDVRIERDKLKQNSEDRLRWLNSRLYVDYGERRINSNNSIEPNVEHNSSNDVNKSLKYEVETLRQKLRDALGDVKALRSKLNNQKYTCGNDPLITCTSMKHEQLVDQLEKLKLKKDELCLDLQCVLDEKEELVIERDAYKCKVHRLNHQLNVMLKGDNQNLIDLDALIMENRLLQERLQQAQEEIKLCNQTVMKYKDMVDKRTNKGSDNRGVLMMSHKQVQELLEKGVGGVAGGATHLSDTPDARSLCLTLYESLGDTSLALSHQKKANRILATRITELEQRLESKQGARLVECPSGVLLEGYTTTTGCCDDDDDVRELSRRDELIRRRLPTRESQTIDKLLPSEECVDKLPPCLKKLVQVALDEIKTEVKQ